MKTAAKNLLLLWIIHVYSITSAVNVEEDGESNPTMPVERIDSNELNIEGRLDAPRTKKILNLFDVVRFPNGACMSTSAGQNGTCYAQDECESKGGTGYGKCAGGYGVCCVFTLRCGMESSENCTYFQSSGGEIGQCRVRICPCREHICQLRLDFGSFVINGPSTLTTSTALFVAAKAGATAGQCLMDTFMVTSPGNPTPPVICGVNSGEHMYVDAVEQCNELAFTLGPSTTEEIASSGVAAAVTRSWNIKITQYDCNYHNLAPDGCTQYFWGVASNVVRSYNFNGANPARHLADQNQNICVRRERGICRLCWAQQVDGDFQLSGASANGFTTSQCCGYKASLAGHTNGYDCILIPGASKAGKTAWVGGGYGFCGAELVTINAMAGPAVATTFATVCTMKVPFNIRFISDHYEFTAGDTAEAAVQPVGFRLTYMSQTC